ncbi:MAG TPA: phosphopantothenoylcysteine decarboxylase [bacterium]|nr:phosphopantothenoylcysteine decarboxylase [bacterium]
MAFRHRLRAGKRLNRLLENSKQPGQNRETNELVNEDALTKPWLAGKRVLITSGPTFAPLDAVRSITNRSTGRLGCAIARSIRKHGAEVVFLAGETSQVPKAAGSAGGGRPLLLVERFVTVPDLKRLLMNHLTGRPFDAVVMAAAVLDYYPVESVAGKKRSDEDEWIVRLKRGEKIIEQIKSWAPDVFLVGFKLEARVSQEELAARAGDLIKRSRADLVVANRLEDIGAGRHEACLVEADPAEGDYRISGSLHTREAIAEHLAARLAERLSSKTKQAAGEAGK